MDHGGDIYTEGILKGKQLLDFSSNINPLGVPQGFRKNVDEALNLCSVYPDAQYRDLRLNISTYLDEKVIKNENIVLGNGAAEIIDLVISCFKNICIVVPSFVEYEKNALKWRCNIIYSPLKENMDFDYDDISEKIKYVNALIIGNPNNPNGQIINQEKFADILEYCEKNGKTVIIDEAFVEFTGSRKYSFLSKLKYYNCLFIVRALTKFFGLPGIRLGYGISKDMDTICKIRRKQNPWNINCFAEVAAKYVLRDKEYIRESIKWINKERDFMRNELYKISVIDRVYETHGNFVLCKLKGIDSQKLYDECMKRYAVIRKCNNYRGLGNNYIRLAVKDRKKNTCMINILQQIAYKKL